MPTPVILLATVSDTPHAHFTAGLSLITALRQRGCQLYIHSSHLRRTLFVREYLPELITQFDDGDGGRELLFTQVGGQDLTVIAFGGYNGGNVATHVGDDFRWLDGKRYQGTVLLFNPTPTGQDNVAAWMRDRTSTNQRLPYGWHVTDQLQLLMELL